MSWSVTTGGDDGNGVGSARSGAGGSVESLDAHVTRCSRGCGQPSLAFSAGFNGLDALLAVGDRTTVLFVGYQGEGTPGRRIQQAAERGGRVFIDGEDVPVRDYPGLPGHMQAICGYDEEAFLVVSSWGEGHGDAGIVRVSKRFVASRWCYARMVITSAPASLTG